MEKPVTELYEAAEHVHAPGHPGHARLERALKTFEHEDRATNLLLLDVLDLVATSNRLDLVRWAAGLSVEQLGEVQGLLEMGTAEAKKRGYPDWEKGVAYGAEFMRAALSGGEGGAKEEPPACTSSGCQSCGFSGGCDQDDAACDQPGECPDAGCEVCCQADEQQPPHPMWGAVAKAVAKEEARPATDDAIGALEARLSDVREKIRSYDGGDRPSSPPMALFREEQDLLKSIEAKEDERDAEKPKPTILPAGKPPPFLRVGMVLESPATGSQFKVKSRNATGSDVRLVNTDGGIATDADSLADWPLAQDFTVEGEAAPAERRKPCTCNSSPSPRRCEGQSKLGEGWYCVEGKP